MRRRPEPSRRRGLLRAAVVVIVLTVILVVILFIVSSLTAPPARAPTVPPTPGPVTLTPVATPPRATPHPGKTKPAAHATSSVKKHVGLASPVLPVAEIRQQPRPRDVMRLDTPTSAATGWRADFEGNSGAYHGALLTLLNARESKRITIGMADPYVLPVWSTRRGELLFVRVRQTSRFPGALWSLMRFDLRTKRTATLLSLTGMSLSPLGWLRGEPLFAVANSSDTSLFVAQAGKAHFVSILATQPVSAPTLSPGGTYIAFVTPADCTYCTLSEFDLGKKTTWRGPSGITSEHDLAWDRRDGTLVAGLGTRLDVIGNKSHRVRQYQAPAPLRSTWAQPFTASVAGRALILTGTVTGKRYRADAVGQE